ncbi:MAG TPA: radical SAM protein [Thermomicrobiales bacterium]|nr:radical SAM protein [Thermomicrobiales bacterium]
MSRHWQGAETDTDARPLVLPRGPRTLYIETSNRCNSLCQTCPLTFFGSPGGAHDLTFEEFRRIVDQAPDLERVVLHGVGEPLLNRHLPDMIRYLKDRGVHVLFNSNAILLTKHWRDLLLDSGLDEFRASLDAATPETYLAIRGVPLHDRVVRHLAELTAARRARGLARPRISVWFTAMRENLAELPAVARIVADAGADEFYVQRLVFFDRGLAVEGQSVYRHLTEREEALLAEAVAICAAAGVGFAASGGEAPSESLAGAEATRPWLACHRPWYLAYVTAHGDVLPCCFAPFIADDLAPVTLGNVFREPLAAIWNGPAYQDFRRRFQTDTPCAICAGCGSKWSV